MKDFTVQNQFWLKMATEAKRKADNNIEGLLFILPYSYPEHYFEEVSARCARLYSVAAYCLIRYNKSL